MEDANTDSKRGDNTRGNFDKYKTIKVNFAHLKANIKVTLAHKVHLYVTTQIKQSIGSLPKFYISGHIKDYSFTESAILLSCRWNSLSCKPHCPFSSYFIMLSSISQV